jgi:adenylate cyclase
VTEKRKLAVVMFTDIVGYTAIMSRYEQKALALLQLNRDLQTSLAEKYDGEFLKEMGDGTLLCFQSALDAVRCALEIQQSVKDNPDLKLRIGIHLGDIVFKGGDVFGDGVNVASRIERLTNEGGICISEDVDKLIRNQPEIRTFLIGAKRLKNIDHPIKIYTLAKEDSDQTLFKPVDNSRGKRFAIKVGGFAVLIFIILLSSYFILFNDAHRRIDSIAVLPIANLSDDPAQEYFVDGMTDALISELAQISALRVISRQSIMQYKDSKKALPDIAKDLNVDALIEGTVLRSGDQIRITVQLVQARPEQHLWTNDYRRHIRNILDLQEEVARSIAEEIHVSVTQEEQARLSSASAVDPDAYEAYLKGRYYWNRRTEEGILKAIAFFNQAIEKDPNYAAAHAGLADCYIVAPSHYALLPSEAYPQARVAATRALEIDDRLSEAYASLAAVRHNYDWAWLEAETLYKHAIEFNPNYATAHQWYAELLYDTGRFDESIAEMKRAQDLDPLSPIINALTGYAYYLTCEYDRAIEELHKTLELYPDFHIAYTHLSRVYSQKSMHEEAIVAAQKARTFSENPRVVAGLGYAYAMAGQEENALSMLDSMMTLSNQKLDLFAGHIAVLYIGLKDTEKAFAWLEKAYKQHDYQLTWAKCDPRFDPLRSDPRFIDLLKRMGLEE